MPSLHAQLLGFVAINLGNRVLPPLRTDSVCLGISRAQWHK